MSDAEIKFWEAVFLLNATKYAPGYCATLADDAIEARRKRIPRPLAGGAPYRDSRADEHGLWPAVTPERK